MLKYRIKGGITITKTVNTIGDQCPIPVIKTKKAIDEMKAQGGIVEILVDNEIAVQNLTRLGKSSGYAVMSEKLEEKKFRVVIRVGAGEAKAEEEEISCMPDSRRKNTVAVISSQCMGERDPFCGGCFPDGRSV